MRLMATPRSAQIAPFLNRTPRHVVPMGRMLALIALMIVCIFLAVMARDEAGSVVLGMFAIFAAIGVAMLFAAAAGFVHFGVQTAISPGLPKLYADNASHAVAVSSSDGVLVYANAAYRQLTGSMEQTPFSIETALVRHFGGSEPLFRLIRASRSGDTAEEEFQSIGTRGSGLWLRASVRRVDAPSDRKAREQFCLWEITDVTTRRQHEAEMVRNAEELRKLLDEVPVGLFSADRAGNVPVVNSTLSTWLDLNESDLQNKSKRNRRDKSGQLKLASMFPEHAVKVLGTPGNTNTKGTASFDVVKHDGTAFPVTVFFARHLAAEEAESETALYGAVLERDLLSESAARCDAQRMLGLLKSAPIAISSVAKDGTITVSNMAFGKFFGAASVLGKSSIFDLSTDEAIRANLHQAVEKATARKVTIPPVDIPISEGKRMVRLFFSPMPRGEQSEDVALVFGIDTSEQRLLEEQIAQSQKMQAIGQLAGGIAHDFNNVLTAIIGFSDLLLTSHRPSDPAFADIMNIKNNANRAAGLVRHLLAFSRKQTLRPQVLSLTDALEDLMHLLAQLLGEKVKAKVIHGRDLWFVKVDPTQFQQVIINLAVNARDAMLEGGELSIRTANVSERESTVIGHGLQPGEYVLCEVSDTGTGIPPEVIDKIFEPFFSTKEVGKGTGLGLSTVYGIVKQTGGNIFCESEVGSGTIFRIYLPRCEDVVNVAETSDKPTKKEPSKDLTGSATVLLVEDEDAVRNFAARALTTRGYNVLTANSGVQALDVMNERGGEVDLVISDVVMPEMDGPTLMKHLRKANPQIKIIFMSGYAEEAFRNNLDEDEKFAFLPKPFTLKKLAAVVKETLDEEE